MADFKTHISTSSVLGVGYAGGAFWYFYPEVPLPTAVLAGGVCGISGMLPDLDSDSGVPLRESMAFAAAVVPMLLVGRLSRLGLSHETMILTGALVYFLVRFVAAKMLKKYTVHRGMFHSIPAGLIFAEVAYLLYDNPNLALRLYLAGGVLVGFMSHLMLDELYSIEWYRGRMRFKKSFGTAIKFWSPKSTWANVSTYVKLAILTFIVFNDNNWMDRFQPHQQQIEHVTSQVLDQIVR